MYLIKGFLSIAIGLAIIAFGVMSMHGVDFDLMEFLDAATRSKSGIAVLAVILMAGGGFLFLGFFYFNMYRARNVDPEIKKFIDEICD
ncbi:hypothetical protein J5226_00500 [Lysobacter sp. K5869]|uniref:hypothetical protein n=1 Tax=Lysobacter sp. K5869 TaxID=2820808 RepID=UPI001C05FC57|nr:hypothetical protein [Lysobacter sp. K5869]QWP76928.1 hypothetical protein J5226_00500 [Lysobacter sp. K5869]